MTHTVHSVYGTFIEIWNQLRIEITILRLYRVMKNISLV